jgi:signal transduction histidine kinase
MDVALPPSTLTVQLAASDLVDLLDILVDNVFAHTPEGAAVWIELGERAGMAVLTIDDAGPGFGARPRRERASGTGLGLDIATRTAAGCGGDLTVGVSPRGGAQVQVRLPLVTQ